MPKPPALPGSASSIRILGWFCPSASWRTSCSGAGTRLDWVGVSGGGRQLTRFAALCVNSGLDVDVSIPMNHLSLAERSVVAIARALSDTTGGRLLVVLDEPTAALPFNEVQRLLEATERMRDEGHGVLLVSHQLDEVLRVSDRVTVLRDGRVVASVMKSEIDYASLTRLIVGPSAAPIAAGLARRRIGSGKVVLHAEELADQRLSRIDLCVHAGEIVGVAGITGSGRESIAPLLTGRLPRSGGVSVNGRSLRSADPVQAMKLGMGSIHGERGRYGTFGNLSVRSNLTISDLTPHRRWGRIGVSSERTEVSEWIDRFGIVTSGTDAPILTLSGGNQQKVLVSRALRLKPKALVLDDPTLGIDVGATRIHP